jgi:transcriptional regulator with XRE-family HTH domain
MLKQFLRGRDFMTAPTIGERLKDIRISRNLSLDEVSRLTGVSKPMLGQIERGQSIPTITTLWKIATGLKTPLSFFLEGQQAEYTIVSPDQANVILGDGGKMRAYPLFTYDPVRSVETFYIEFDPGCRHSSDKHNDGVEEHIFVLRGTLRLVLGDKTIDVGERQAVRFRADMPHAYQNLSGDECSVYNTIFYPSH